VRLASALLALCWVVGLVRFVLARPVVELTLPRRAARTRSDTRLAALSTGPTLRASSMERNPSAFRHVAYLVDGRANPSSDEKWASRFDDPAPWVELRFRKPHHLERVVVRHVSDVEPDAVAVRRYRVTCLRAKGAGPSVDVRGNQQALVSHPLDCRNALGVRLDLVPNEARKPVALYEIEAIGR